MQIDISDDDDPIIRAVIADSLGAHNSAALGMASDRRTVAVLHRNAEGHVTGGMWGTVRFGWMMLEIAYLALQDRGTGLGARTLAAMERAASHLGAHGVRTGSFSFQAPGFYIKQGYTEYARLEGHPPGHQDVALYKRLTPGGACDPMVTQDPDDEAHDTLRGLLRAYNTGFAGPSDARHLGVTVRDDHGNVLGGLVGTTSRGWLSVEQVALPPSARGTGVGTRMMQMAHSEAQARGVVAARLATASYQARPFYEKLGYAAYGEIPDYLPGGHARFLMARRFDR